MDALIRQLKDKDPAQRRAAILALGNSKDKRALKYLAEVYRNDPDPALQQLAYKAGAFIKKHGEAEADSSTYQSPEPEFESQPRHDMPVKVSDKDKDRAQGYLDRALDFHMNGNKAQVAENLLKALQYNPNLRKDSVAAGLAAETFGRNADEAFDMLMNEQVRAQVKARSQAQKSAQRSVETSEDLANAGFYGLVLWLVMFIGTVVLLYLASQVISAENLQEAFPTEDQEALSNIEALSVGAILLTALIYSVINVIGVAASAGAIHAIARYLLVGSGSFLGFFWRYSLFQAIYYGVGMVAYVFFMLSPSPNFFFIFALAATLGGLYGLYYLVQMIGRYYNFGACSGCMAIFGGTLLLVAVYMGLIFMMGFLLAALAG